MCVKARRRKQESILKLLEESSQRLQLYAHGAEMMKEDEAAHTALQRHLLRGVGLQVLDLILRHLEVRAVRPALQSGLRVSILAAQRPLCHVSCRHCLRD